MERVGPAARGHEPGQAQEEQEDQGSADGHLGRRQEQGQPGGHLLDRFMVIGYNMITRKRPIIGQSHSSIRYYDTAEDWLKCITNQLSCKLNLVTGKTT